MSTAVDTSIIIDICQPNREDARKILMVHRRQSVVKFSHYDRTLKLSHEIEGIAKKKQFFQDQLYK